MGKKRNQKTVGDTVCRIHKFGGYAVLSNCFVRSTNLGCPAIPYEDYGINGSGVEFHIVGGSEMYACLNDFYQKLGKEIRIIAAWSNRSSEHAWTIVSFVTC